MTALEFLHQPRQGGGTMLARIAELIAVNGGRLHVSGWGCISSNGGPYGRAGLEQDEALELIYWGGVLDGLVVGEPTVAVEIREAIQNELDRRKRGWEEQQAAMAEGGSHDG